MSCSNQCCPKRGYRSRPENLQYFKLGIGWESAVIGLTLHLSGRPAVDPKNSMAWVTSEEGKRFMRLSGEHWCEAHIASGDDEAEARAMAERTVAAYTGAPTEPSG